MGKLIAFVLFLYPSLTGYPQVCTGSLGDPVLNITFGTGNNPGPRLAAGASSYTYTPQDCPGDGQYSIRNLTFRCNTDTWHTVPFDHTPQDGNNGYYMQINGGDQAEYLKHDLSGLCPNTTYELSFWVMNLSKPGTACDGNATLPDIRYTVETAAGVVLSTAKTGGVSQKTEAVWTQYALLFKSVSVPVVLRLTSNSGNGCGMDFLLDDIMVRPCGPDIQAAVASTGLFSTKACEGDPTPIQLKATIGAGFTDPLFQWQVSMNSGSSWTDVIGAVNTTYLRPPSKEGQYVYRLMVGEASNPYLNRCRLPSNLIYVTIEKAPFAQGTNYSYCVGKDIMLFAAGGEKYFWTGPKGFTSNLQSPVIPNIDFSDSGLYKVQVTTSAGCKASDSTHLFIYSNPIAVVSPEVNICEGSSTILLAGGGTQYNWTPAAGLSSSTVANPAASPRDTTLYTVLVTMNGCTDTASVRVNVWKKPRADAGPDKQARKGQSVQLSGSVRGTDVSYHWTPDLNMTSSRSLNPRVTVSENATFTLHVISDKGCGTSTDEMQVKVYDKVYIPNAFSPNGDGINDVWNIVPLNLFGDTQTQVFNRYGQLVFNSRGYATPWDGTRAGKALPSGTYYYIIDMKNGSAVMRGSVLIVR